MYFHVPSFDLNTSDEMERFSSIYGTYPSMGNPIPSTILSTLPHLQHLTIRGFVYRVSSGNHDGVGWFVSCFRAVVDILKNAPPLQRLTIDIDVDLQIEQLGQFHFPIFKALTEYSSSFRHIELYIRNISERDIVPLFGEYGGVTALIERDILVIYMNEIAPGDTRFEA